MREKIEDFLFDYFQIIILGIAIVFVIGFVMFCRIIIPKEDIKLWNDGYCSCGGKWVYEQAVGHYHSTDYLYHCDRCGETHEFTKRR